MTRKESYYFRMRNFHSYIKYSLINEYSPPKKGRLFDISVGRAGDLHHWKNSNLDFVYGIDPNESFIEEAKSRASKNTNFKFEVKKITDDFELDKMYENYFDVVSCQFSLHYMFDNEENIENALKKVSYSLKPNGYFIGTSVDGNLIKTLKSQENDYYSIQLHEDHYTFTLKDKDTGNYFHHADEKEYYVSKHTFIQLCKKYNLELKIIQPFRTYTAPEQLQEHEKFISNLYFSFVFVKVLR